MSLSQQIGLDSHKTSLMLQITAQLTSVIYEVHGPIAFRRPFSRYVCMEHPIAIQSAQCFLHDYFFAWYYSCSDTAMHIMTVANLVPHPTG